MTRHDRAIRLMVAHQRSGRCQAAFKSAIGASITVDPSRPSDGQPARARSAASGRRRPRRAGPAAGRRRGRPGRRSARGGTSSTNRRAIRRRGGRRRGAASSSQGTSRSETVGAQAAGEGHLGQGDGQAPFAQVVAAPDQPAADRRVDGPEDAPAELGVDARARCPRRCPWTSAQSEPPSSSRVMPTSTTAGCPAP